MFREARSFNQPLDNWNVSNVRRMRRMFNHANSFNQPLNNWNVSRVTNMGAKFAGGMFNGASSFNQPLHAPWYVVEQWEESDTDSESE